MQRKIIIAILLLVFTPLLLSAKEGLTTFREGYKYGYKNESGRIVIPAIFDDAYWFSNGLAAVKQNGKYGFIDKSGNFVIPAKFYESWSFSEGCREPQATDADRSDLAAACLDVAKSLFRQIGCNRRRNLHVSYFPGIASGRVRYLR